MAHNNTNHRVCPPWVARTFLLNPLRKLLENPEKMLRPYVKPGMTVLEPGCAMGYFTLPLARMVGPQGRVIAVDIQEAMTATMQKRARKAGLADRIEVRRVTPESLEPAESESADLVAAMHVVHEAPDAKRFLAELKAALKPGGTLLIIEAAGHVKRDEFATYREHLQTLGFDLLAEHNGRHKRELAAVLPEHAEAIPTGTHEQSQDTENTPQDFTSNASRTTAAPLEKLWGVFI